MFFPKFTWNSYHMVRGFSLNTHFYAAITGQYNLVIAVKCTRLSPSWSPVNGLFDFDMEQATLLECPALLIFPRALGQIFFSFSPQFNCSSSGTAAFYGPLEPR